MKKHIKSFKNFKDAKNFKKKIEDYVFDDSVRKHFNRLSIDTNDNGIIVKSKDMPSEEDVKKWLKTNLDRFNMLHSSSVHVKNVTSDSFVLEDN